MSRTEIDDEIRKTVLSIASKYLEPDEIEAKQDDVFSIDSLDVVDIIIELEKEFAIKFANEEVQSIETFEQLMEMIRDKRNAKSGLAPEGR